MATGPGLSLVLIVALGVGASWLAWRLGAPSILFLLLAGFAAGPLTGVLDPDAVFGELLLPFVSLAVAVILFEGGLSLRLVELKQVGRAVRNLVTVGVLVTWIIIAAAAYYLVGLSVGLSALVGAILVVTGPTVIIPLLRHLRPSGQVGSILKWEGILVDPIGVILAVLVFEVIIASGPGEATLVVLRTVGVSLAVGTLLGIAAGSLMVVVLRRHWVSDQLESPLALALVLLAALGSDMVQTESGLVAATVMGVWLANQKDVNIRHILEFKENLRVLLISVLFIVLAARIDRAALGVLGPGPLLFLVVAFLVARPAAVAISTLGTTVPWRERVFLSALAPRGIVAAAISSVFALELARRGHAEADQIVPLVFLTIVATVAIYGLAARPIARALKVADPNPQGVLILGAHDLARELAAALSDADVNAVLVDTNPRNVMRAWDRGLRARGGNVMNEAFLEELDLAGLGHLMAITPNDEVNQLGALALREVFERKNVYQLPPRRSPEELAPGDPDEVPGHLRGRYLFGEGFTYARLASLVDAGWGVRTRRIDAPEDANIQSPGPEADWDLRPSAPPPTRSRTPSHPPSDDTVPADEPQRVETDVGFIPLVLVRADGTVRPFTVAGELAPQAGDLVVELARPDLLGEGEAESSAEGGPEAASGAHDGEPAP